MIFVTYIVASHIGIDWKYNLIYFYCFITISATIILNICLIGHIDLITNEMNASLQNIKAIYYILIPIGLK